MPRVRNSRSRSQERYVLNRGEPLKDKFAKTVPVDVPLRTAASISLRLLSWVVPRPGAGPANGTLSGQASFGRF